MPSPLIGAAHYPQVRAAIDPTLSATQLPDAVLAMPIYVPAGIEDVLRVVPDAEQRTDPTEVQHLQNAAVYFSAARASTALPQMAGERYADYAYTLAKADPEARAASLRAIAEGELVPVLPPGTTTGDAVRPVAFALARGYRGRLSVPGPLTGGVFRW